MQTFDFNTPKGIRAVADHLETLAGQSSPDSHHQIGHLRIRNNPAVLMGAAALIRGKASSAAAKRGPVNAPSIRPTITPVCRRPSGYFDNRSPVLALDAVRVCGSPEAALETIRRQLATQAESMEPSDVRRCEKAASEIERFLANEAAIRQRQDADSAEADRIDKATPPGLLAITPTGTEVMVSHRHSDYLGKVIECRVGACPTRGKNHPVALYTVEITHIREWRDQRYALHPIKSRKLSRLHPTDIRILAPAATPPEHLPASPSTNTPTQDMKTKPTKTTATGILQLPAKLIAAASTDKAREVINGVLIDAENRSVVVTNGRILATVDIPGTAPVRDGYITPELWKSATIMARKGPVILDYAHGTIAGLPYPTLEEWGSKYPDWKAVTGMVGQSVYRTRLDPELLLHAATALGWNKDTADHTGITLDFSADAFEPIALRVATGSSGLIIPMGDEKNTAGHGLRIASVSSNPQSTIHNPQSETSTDHLAQLKSITSERDSLQSQLTAARNRITALEAAAKHRQAIADHAAKSDAPAPERSPAPAPATGAPRLDRNGQKNGIELRFSGKPDDATREALKSHGFRWAPGQPDKPWIAKYTEERWVFATALAEGRKVEPIDPAPQEITGIEPAAAPEPPATTGLFGQSAAAPEHSPAVTGVPDIFAGF